MTDPDEEISPPPRSRLRWLKRLAGWSVGVAAVVALVLFVSRWQVGRLGQRELNVTLTRLDTDEPDWRLEALLA